MTKLKFSYPMQIKSVKSVDGANYIEGYASTWNKDRDGDIIVPSAFDKTMDEYMTNPQLLIDHSYRMEDVIGNVVEFKIDDVGLWIKAKLITPITDKAKQVVGNIIDGFSKTLSIGGYFERVQNVITAITLYEISAVTIPANSECRFSMAKMLHELKEEKEKDGEPGGKTVIEPKTEKINKEDTQMTPMTPEEMKKAMDEQFKKIADEAKAAKEKEAEDLKAAEAKKVADEKAALEAEKKIKEKIDAGINLALAGIRKDSKIEFPVSMKVGNLAIEDKQLVDLIMRRETTVSMVDGKLEKFAFKGGQVLLRKAGVGMDTDEAGGGAEWVPTEMARTLIDLVRIKANVYGLFEEFKMPTKVWENPIKTSDPVWKLVAENTDADTKTITPANHGTGKMTLTSKKVGAGVVISNELDEDSAIALLQSVKDTIATSAAENLDSMIINGDTAYSQDSDSSASDAIAAWNGLRKLALAISGLKGDLATFSAANLSALIGKLKKYAGALSDLAIIIGPGSYWTNLTNLESSTGGTLLLKEDKTAYGGFGYMKGIPVVVSDKMREDLNASGVYDASTTSKSTLLIVRRGAFKTGSRRLIRFMATQLVGQDAYQLDVTMRNAFSPVRTPSASVTSVAIGYNIA